MSNTCHPSLEKSRPRQESVRIWSRWSSSESHRREGFKCVYWRILEGGIDRRGGVCTYEDDHYNQQIIKKF
jgi:hypothetical protein